jgi:hypothetical protein
MKKEKFAAETTNEYTLSNMPIEKSLYKNEGEQFSVSKEQ